MLTPAAAAKVKEIIREGQANGMLPGEKLYLRVRVVKGEYKLDLDPATDSEDRLGESLGVQTVVDKTAALSIDPGTVLDYLDEDGQKGFKFKPPSAVELGSPDANTTLAERGAASRPTRSGATRQEKRRPHRPPKPSAW